MKKPFLLVLFVLLTGCSQQVMNSGLETEAFSGITLHLNPSDSNASDSNDGSSSAPLKTVQGAYDKMIVLKQTNNVRLLIYPGVYREVLVSKDDHPSRPFWKIPENNNQLVFEGTEAGKVIFSGSDVWKEWQSQGGGRWVHTWNFDWGAPPKFNGGPTIPEIGARRELVFVNGKRVTQVLKGATLSDYSFLVDEAANQLVLKLPSNVNPNTATTEVGVRSNLFYIWNRSNVQLRKLTFQHSVDKFEEAAVSFQDGLGKSCSGIQITDTWMINNGQSGLELNCHDSYLYHNRADGNGFTGIGGSGTYNLTLDHNTTNLNAWRPWSAGFKGWSPSGLKFFVVQDITITRHAAIANQGNGLWLDTDIENAVVKDSIIAKNFWDGLYLEASRGPITASNNLICGNGNNDVILSSVNGVTLENNRILSNGVRFYDQASQPTSASILFGEVRRKETNVITNQPNEYPTRNITLKNNSIVSADPARRLIYGSFYFANPNPKTPTENAEIKADYQVFMDTLRLSGNTWYSPDPKPFYLTASSGHIQTSSFPEWKTLTKQDSNSSFSNPNLTCLD